MSRVKKREIIVSGQRYIWTLKGNRIDVGESHIKVFKEGCLNSILYINPYDWTFEIRPSTIQKAIIFALNNGWNPNKNGSSIHIEIKESEFFISQS